MYVPVYSGGLMLERRVEPCMNFLILHCVLCQESRVKSQDVRAKHLDCGREGELLVATWVTSRALRV